MIPTSTDIPNYKYENVEQILKEATKLIKLIEEFEIGRMRYETSLGFTTFEVSINSMNTYYRISISEERVSIADSYEYDIDTKILKYSGTTIY